MVGNEEEGAACEQLIVDGTVWCLNDMPHDPLAPILVALFVCAFVAWLTKID